ncbi:MAG: PAS domain-containing protein [Rhodobacteraceae bacterium]|nr:PAS domain-containing protein [Paracoccaceae bacterium]
MSDPVTDPLTAGQRLAGVLHLPFTPRGGALDFPAVRAVRQHWDALRAGRLAPARADLDPRPLAHCLDVMFVAELVAPSVARLRLCGQQLGDLLGMEPRGMPLSVFFNGDARTELAGALSQVAQGARAVMPLRSDAGLGQPAIDGLLALMPLTDTDGRITRILGVLETRGPAGRAPRRFRLSAPLRMENGARADQPSGPVSPVTDLTAAVVTPVRGEKPRLRVIRGGKL